MDRLLSSNKVAGIKQTRNAVVSGNAKVVFLADDISPSIKDEIHRLCAEHSVEVVGGVTRRELAARCRIDVPCAVCAVLCDNK